MTYILGWKNYNSVFLVGDSVITFEHPKSYGNKNTFREKTTFGEDHIYEEEKTVSETWLKLYDLDQKVILAISGEVKDAYEGVKNFKYYLENTIDVEGAFKHAFEGRDVGIIAGYMVGDFPRLISYNCKGKRGFHEHSFLEVAHSGSIDSSFENQTEEFFSQIETKQWNEDQILTSIIAVTQSFCYQGNIIKRGVGGFFSGIRINKDGVNWQSDLAFIPFSYNGKDIETNKLSEIFGDAKIAMTQVRDSILYAHSPFQNDARKARRPFANFESIEIIQSTNWFDDRLAWGAKWGKEVNRNCDYSLADYYIFYNTEKPIVALIYSIQSKPFKIIDGSMMFIDSDFINFINSANDRIDDSISVHLSL
jgi:hypothetical protein